MSKKTQAYFKGIPMKPFDLIREALIVSGVLAIVILALSIIFSSPDYPPVRGEDVAKLQPVSYLKTSAGILAGQSSVQAYGPPYTKDVDNSQEFLGIKPAVLFGVTIPINASNDLVLRPLEKIAVLDKGLASALSTYKTASPKQQSDWATVYLGALDKAKISPKGNVTVPKGNFGPVQTMMNSMLNLGKAGLLEGSLDAGPRQPYVFDLTRPLLYFQDDVDHNVADSLDMMGDQWGISHETGNYPGAWWLYPYAFFYQIPPMNASANGDLQVGIIMTVLFLVLLFVPFIPVLNAIPRWLGIYRIIWRDWYAREKPPAAQAQPRKVS
ncbi:MAG: hypothetical protein ACYC56_08320 [Candidatus Aquicultor sp.]